MIKVSDIQYRMMVSHIDSLKSVGKSLQSIITQTIDNGYTMIMGKHKKIIDKYIESIADAELYIASAYDIYSRTCDKIDKLVNKIDDELIVEMNKNSINFLVAPIQNIYDNSMAVLSDFDSMVVDIDKCYVGYRIISKVRVLGQALHIDTHLIQSIVEYVTGINIDKPSIRYSLNELRDFHKVMDDSLDIMLEKVNQPEKSKLMYNITLKSDEPCDVRISLQDGDDITKTITLNSDTLYKIIDMLVD